MENNKKDSAVEKPGKPLLKPDPKTINTADPQDNMEGPVSSVMQETKERFEDNASKPEADHKKHKNM